MLTSISKLYNIAFIEKIVPFKFFFVGSRNESKIKDSKIKIGNTVKIIFSRSKILIWTDAVAITSKVEIKKNTIPAWPGILREIFMIIM